MFTFLTILGYQMFTFLTILVLVLKNKLQSVRTLIFNDNNYLPQSFDNTFDDSLLPHKMQLLVQFL